MKATKKSRWIISVPILKIVSFLKQLACKKSISSQNSNKYKYRTPLKK